MAAVVEEEAIWQQGWREKEQREGGHKKRLEKKKRGCGTARFTHIVGSGGPACIVKQTSVRPRQGT